MNDVIVVGAGIAGSATARELSRYNLSIEVIEAGYDVACGATRTNSGIVHGGYDPEPGTLKAKYNVAGAYLIPEMSKELGFRYINNGSLVLALEASQMPKIDELLERAVANGIDGCKKLTSEEVLALEPNVNPEVAGALYCPHSGICDPFGMCVAYAENAAVNGVKFTFNTRVETVEAIEGGYRLTLDNGETRECKCVVNAAGVYAIDLHNQVSANKLESRPRKGEYELMSRSMGNTFSHVMFQAPGPKGKGVLISPTVEGNLIVGPDAVDGVDPEDTASTPEGLAWVVDQAKNTWPTYNARETIVNFAGVRPSGADGDFVVGEVEDAPGFFDIAAFDSPGLTSGPAVAVDVATWVAQKLDATDNENFVSHRDMPLRFIEMDEEARSEAIENNSKFAHIICRCEQVTEAEVLDCIHAPIPALSIVGIKRRCRAGTGKCQGGFCAPVVAEIVARETGMGIDEVCLMGPGTEVAPFKRENETI